MSLEDYTEAHKAGRRNYRSRLWHGERPTLAVLDDILPLGEKQKEVSLGLVDIPMERIVGTRYEWRSQSFAANFMPIMNEETEFAQKWAELSTSHTEEGIREPIKAWEYMNLFYVEEGHKRVSVLKYFDAVSVPGVVTRILPKRTDEKENRIYYEFVDFYEKSKVNYIWFSREGSFAALQKAVGLAPDEAWMRDERLRFASLYSGFTASYEKRGGKKLSITTGDAFLAFITLYGYDTVYSYTSGELDLKIAQFSEEFRMLEADEEVALKMEPVPPKKSLFDRLISGMREKEKLRVAFIFNGMPDLSVWNYRHELGRLYLESSFPDEVITFPYYGVTQGSIDETLQNAVDQGCDIIFTTSPIFAPSSVKAAIRQKNVRILNCSLNTSHRYIRNYYARFYEAKFLMGAIAGAMARNNRLLYIADYPIYGIIANINAFALGARLVNPRAEVYVEWRTKKDADIISRIKETDPACVSARDMILPGEESHFAGIYYRLDELPHSLAMPLTNWGVFYEKMIRSVMEGTWKYDDDTSRAINYWWGMSSGVVDVLWQESLPIGTKRLAELLRKMICQGEFNPFAGKIYSQSGIVRDHDEDKLAPEEIMRMDWLAENVIGSIPKEYELTEQARLVVRQSGVESARL